MAVSCKTLMKPKVRFNDYSESTDDSDTPPGIFKGPRIKSIITLDKPVKLVRGTSQELLPENVTEITTTPLSSYISAPCLTEIYSIEENLGPTKSGKSDNNVEVSSQKPSKDNDKNPNKQISTKSLTIPKKNYVESNKENITQKSAQLKKERNARVKSQDRAKITQKKKVIPEQKCRVGGNLKSPATLQSKSVDSEKAKELIMKNKEVNTAMKPRKKTAIRRSKSQVRSEMVNNLSKAIPNFQVGPGMPRARTRSLSSALEKIQIRPSKSVDQGSKLDRPEYNSILFTIKKLSKMKNEKIATDVNSLPANYKNLCLKKMSSALDFPPGESIYHDLIDLSISENVMPMRLMRSKDPEPRQKDLEPRLSDFFTPQYGNEYFEAVKIRPRSPEIIDNFNAFKISDRIFNWKACLNEL